MTVAMVVLSTVIAAERQSAAVRSRSEPLATLPAPEDRILSVGELTRGDQGAARRRIRRAVWVKGEISGYKGAHQSGHLYFKHEGRERQRCRAPCSGQRDQA